MTGAIPRDPDPAISIGVVLKEAGVAGGVMKGETCRFQRAGSDRIKHTAQLGITGHFRDAISGA